jgi:hypothetical protein
MAVKLNDNFFEEIFFCNKKVCILYTLNLKMIVMKKIFTLFSVFFTGFVFAGTPVINGVYSASEGWGTEVAVGNGTAGWGDANAKKLYVTYDNNYVYFGAECTAQNWQQFVFAVNTKAGGGSTDSWGRQITYNHTNKPDFLFRGDIAGGNYAEYHVWNGTAWTGLGTNVNAGGTEVKGVFDGLNNGFLEIRVPRSTIGFGIICDVQFIIGGNANDHGCFDAIPNDNNSTGWNPPQSSTSLSNYVTNVSMPASLGFLKGDIKNNVANITWLSTTEVNFSHYDVEASVNTLEWTKVASVTAKGSNSSYAASTAITKNTWYRLKLVDKDGAYAYSNSILLRTSTRKSLELMSNPTKDIIRVSINNDVNTSYVAELFTQDGKRVATQNYQHISGTSVFTIKAPKTAGLYYLRFSNNGLVSDLLKVKVD